MDAVEQKILAAVDAQRETLLAFAQDIGAHAEPGFFETRTAARVAELLRGCGLSPQTGLARTGVKAVLQGGAPGPCAAVIGELDGILCPAHPAANPENGVAHACGHNAQLTALVGAALALSAHGVAEALSGSVAFFAVPAEEYVPIGTRQALQKQGVEFCCGKSELLRTGGFDGVDLALTTHVHMIPCESDLLLGNVACNGFTSKTVVFHGKAAHAATAPHAGVNALNAAALALNAVGLLRETFRECDTVRIHTNIREGGAALNVVPETVVMEAMVRAATLEALDDAARKFDRACTHAAEALGARRDSDLSGLHARAPGPGGPRFAGGGRRAARAFGPMRRAGYAEHCQHRRRRPLPGDTRGELYPRRYGGRAPQRGLCRHGRGQGLYRSRQDDGSDGLSSAEGRRGAGAPDNGRIHPRVYTGKLYRNSKEAGLMAQRICFLGRGGSGKSTVAQNLGHALALKGYHVLLVGNDISLSSTVLLRGEADISPALEDYREHYEIDLNDYVIPTPSGVYCLELGSIDPGVGCLARGVTLIDEMLDTQGVSNSLQLDFILYDISGETPCTGYILPIREGVMQRCIIVTNGSFASVTTANSILQAILRAAGADNFPVQLIVNNASCEETKEELASYARRATIEILASLDYCKELEYSSLAGKTVFDTAPDSACAAHLRAVADDLLLSTIPTSLTPFPRRELVTWLRCWQRRELARRLALADTEACDG